MLGCETGEFIGRNSHAACHHTREDGTPCPENECPIRAAFSDGKVHRLENEQFCEDSQGNQAD